MTRSKSVFMLLNRFSELGFSSRVKHDYTPKPTTFAPYDENYYYEAKLELASQLDRLKWRFYHHTRILKLKT